MFAYFTTATILACSSSTLENGRDDQAASATQGDFSKMPPSASVNAAWSILLTASTSRSAA